MVDQNRTYTDKVGLPPGSLVYIGKQRTQKVTVSEIDYSETITQSMSFTSSPIASNGKSPIR